MITTRDKLKEVILVRLLVEILSCTPVLSSCTLAIGLWATAPAAPTASFRYPIRSDRAIYFIYRLTALLSYVLGGG